MLLENDDPPEVVEPIRGAAPPTRHWRGDLFLLLGYVVASLVFWREVLPHLATHALGGGLLDPGLFIWFLNWTPYAITHGLDPFRTTYIDAPIGVSAMWNTSVVGLGVLFAPVTLAFGPIASFNLACILGPPLSAWTAALWLRRYVDRPLPAALGGLLFGFSPFVLAQSRAGHLMFTWLVLVPVILMLAEDLLWRAPRPIWPQAPLLGVVVAMQLLISTETLLIVSMLIGLVALALALRHPHAALERLRVLVPAGAVAVGVGLALCAWPLYEIFGGGREIKQPVQKLGSLGGSVAMLVRPSRTFLFKAGPPHGHLTSVENGMYLGWPLILALVVATVWLVRRPGVLIAAATVIVAAALQIYGTHWHIVGVTVRAPLDVLQGTVALTRDILPGRFAIAMWIAIAWLSAVALDWAWQRAPDRRWRIVAGAVAIACLIPLLPAKQDPTGARAAVPKLFSTSLRNTIPEGATVMIAPMSTVGDNAPQLWQIAAGMRFRQVGGYALHAIGPDASPSYYPYPKMLRRLFMIDYRTGLPYGGVITDADLAAARQELRGTGATMFLVGPSFIGTNTHLGIAQLLLGRPPDRTVGGVAIWDLHPR